MLPINAEISSRLLLDKAEFMKGKCLYEKVNLQSEWEMGGTTVELSFTIPSRRSRTAAD